MIAVPADFLSDGCTGFVNTWRGIDLLPCCRAHDYAWFLHPGDWGVWLASNLDLSMCFAGQGAPELALPALLAVCGPIGALLFAGVVVNKRNKRQA